MSQEHYLVNARAIIGHCTMWIVRLKKGYMIPGLIGSPLNEFSANLFQHFIGDSYKTFTEEELREVLKLHLKAIPMFVEWYQRGELDLEAVIASATASLIKEFTIEGIEVEYL